MKKLLSTCLTGACAAGALAATWTWTGSAGNAWTTAANWSVVGSGTCVYPCDTDDDVLIPVKSGAGDWGDIFFNFTEDELNLDDMTILDGVVFRRGLELLRTMTVDTFTIDATDEAVTVRFNFGIDFTAS